MNLYRKFQHANRTITIFYDDEPVNPVKDYDLFSHFVCAHKRYNLGHEQSEAMTEAELRESVKGIVAVLPLYLYDHSGLTISTTPFSCGYDSGQIGWAYITREACEKMGASEWANDEAKLLEVIRGEVVEYNYYLTGECYGYTITGANGDELESVWGFLGKPVHCEQEAAASAERSEDPAVALEVAFLNNRPTYASVL